MILEFLTDTCVTVTIKIDQSQSTSTISYIDTQDGRQGIIQSGSYSILGCGRVILLNVFEILYLKFHILVKGILR